ncbi:MAG: flagellar hook-length control protein FliK, partial [bacterium]
EKNIASAQNKLSALDLQPKKAIAQSADKTTESRSFWENVSSRLTVRKEISEQPSGNMGSQQFLTEANSPDTLLNSKDISSVNERLNQLFDLTDQDNVLDQVVKKVEIDLKPGQTEMRMQLKPENLGEVQMKVVVEDGKLNAHFLTSTATAKEALEANVQQLKQSLQEQGVRVEKIAVLLSSGDLQFNQKQQDESLYQNQKVAKNWRKSGIADYESSDEAVVSRVTDSNQILSAEQVDYRA